ncbi:hypothetical protein DOY81_010394, partial [Sarcophaga bullata]
GVGMIAGPPIAGAIYEATLRWDDSFYFAGAFIGLSGIASYQQVIIELPFVLEIQLKAQVLNLLLEG